MVFVELSAFTRLLPDYLSDDEYRELQQYLIDNPTAGNLIRGTNGLRKVRWAAKGKGKSGGVRVIYYLYVQRDQIFMLTIYGKNIADDMTDEQRKALTAAVKVLTNER